EATALALCHCHLARRYAEKERLKEAEELFLEALAIYDRIIAPGLVVPQDTRDLISARLNLGFLYLHVGQVEKALVHQQAAMERARALLKARPGPDSHRRVGLCHHHLGLSHAALKKHDLAENAYGEALTSYGRDDEDRPARDRLDVESDRAWAYSGRA